MSKPKIITIDIETSPIEAYTWGIWEQNVGVEQIKTEWTILSYAAKWLDSKKVIYSDTGGRGKAKVRDDKKLVGEIWTLLDSADLVIAQNGARFDIKKINSRLVMHGFGPYSPIRVVDTLSVAKKHFGFTSNKLAWMSKYLTDNKKSEHKKFPGFELWLQCLEDNPAAWAEMKKYNIQDVVTTEELYLKQLPWISGHPNVAAYSDVEGYACTNCGSRDVVKNGYALLQAGRYQRYSCKACGTWGRGKDNLLTKDKRKTMLVRS